MFGRIVMSFLLSTTVCLASNWYVAENPISGNAEAVWSSSNTQACSDILYSHLDGSSWASPTSLSVIGKQGASPVMVFDESGGRFVAWQTSSNTIVLRNLAYGTSVWTSERTISDLADIASRPSATVAEGATYVSYETTATLATGGVTHQVVVTRVDPGGNVERTTLRSTTMSSPLATQVHSEAGVLWVEWIDSSGLLGYSTYVGHAWMGAQFEAYGGPSDIGNARERIRQHLLMLD